MFAGAVQAQRTHLVAPPQADHPAEFRSLQSVARRMVGAQRGQAAMSDGDHGSRGSRGKFDLDFGLLERGEGLVSPGKVQPPGRLPYTYPAAELFLAKPNLRRARGD